MNRDKSQNITLLIADDEATIRNGLSKVVPWEQFGITVIGTAHNGREAFSMMKHYHPDIVITDIRMPEMDGLELMERAKEYKIHTNFIILSGYDDFQYAQKAIGLGARYYFLKPIKIAELIAEIRKIKETMLQSDHVKSYSEYLDVKSEPKEKFLKQLMKNEFHSYEEIDGEIYKLKLNLSEIPYRVMVFSMRNQEGEEQEDEFSQMKFLMDIVREELEVTRSELLLMSSDQLLAIVHCTGNDGQEVDYHFLAGKCINRVKHNFFINLLVGIGGESDQLTECVNSYKQAMMSLSYSFYQTNLEIYDETVVCREMPVKGANSIDYNQLLYLITMNQKEKIKAFCKDYFEQLQYVAMPPPSYIKGMCIYLVTDIQKELLKHQNAERQFPKIDMIVQINHIDTFRELKIFVELFLIDCAETLASAEILSNNQTVRAAEYYIKSHMNEKILAKDVAKHVGLSDVYFASYFKMKTGINFRDYVIQIKMEYAKSFMKQNPNTPVAEVGETVGYDDYRSFYRAFKQYTGVTPSDYLKYRE